MAEFIFKRTDYTHPDPDKDRRGVHKRTDLVNFKPDGWSAHPNWAQSSYPKDFIVVKVPGITLSEAQASDHRRSWRDDFDYEVVATRPAQGRFDVRIFEKNAGAIGQNHIAGVKATKVRSYLMAWGCSNFGLTATDASFTFSLWDAVRSANFWDLPVTQLAGLSFALDGYVPATGVGTITVTVSQEAWGPFEKDGQPMTQLEIEALIGERVNRKVTERGGTVISQVYPNFTFKIERRDILTRFRQDVKRCMEQVYIRHQYGISQTDHDAIMAAGGIVTMTKAEFLSKLINKMAG
ncbi:MAG: hypothetical protein MUC33_01315 [Desulfobacterales bacterium]|jgi:hypothetical protein|nr:hypothetical protein [Desulfobacterales bacterium]MCU0601282.1 hypothetical protein [Desulfobacterales bacterium]